MIVESIRSEFVKYKTLIEGALDQVSDEHLHAVLGDDANSIAVLMRHLVGNLVSRFTDFLASDGEKSWRDRDQEFEYTQMSRHDLLEQWEKAWDILTFQLDSLTDRQLGDTVTIRGNELTIAEALHRSLAHFSYHAGQIIVIARYVHGKNWKYLTIPKGHSRDYNRNPDKEKYK